MVEKYNLKQMLQEVMEDKLIIKSQEKIISQDEIKDFVSLNNKRKKKIKKVI